MRPKKTRTAKRNKKPTTHHRLCCSFVASGSKTLPRHQQSQIKKKKRRYFSYTPGKVLIPTTLVCDWEMNHKALLLWIFLQCAAALFSSALGENAVLKGKKSALCPLFIHFYDFCLCQPHGEVSDSQHRGCKVKGQTCACGKMLDEESQYSGLLPRTFLTSICLINPHF